MHVYFALITVCSTINSQMKKNQNNNKNIQFQLTHLEFSMYIGFAFALIDNIYELHTRIGIEFLCRWHDWAIFLLKIQ